MITPVQHIKSADTQDIKKPQEVKGNEVLNKPDTKVVTPTTKSIETQTKSEVNSTQSKNESNSSNINEKNIIRVGSTAPKVFDKPHHSGKRISLGGSYHGMHKAGNWVKVKDNNGNTGYINHNDIPQTQVNNSAPVVDQTNHVVGRVTPNDNVKVVSTNQDSNGNVTVIHNNSIGNVNVRAFSPSVNHSEVNIPDSIINTTIYSVDSLPSGWNLNFRSGAGLGYTVLNAIPSNTKLNVISKVGEWYKVKYEGQVGYVFGGYVKETVTSVASPSSGLKQYFGSENSKAQNTSFNQFINNGNYQNLTLNHYRPVNIQMLNTMLANANAGSLAGQAQTIADAAKKWNLDPVALTAQMALECGWGRSVMGRGTVIDQVATSNGMVGITPTRVYNLMGIGADDGDAYVDGTTYAYDHGWTSIQKAIYGTAQFLSTQYVNNTTYDQNTAYRFVHAPNPDNAGHDYAESDSYGKMVGQMIAQLAPCYLHSDKFSYAYN